MQLHRSIVALAWLAAASGGALLPAVISPAAAAGDPAAGKQVFETACSICHSPQQGRNMIGPTLFGVVGRKSAAVDGYNYSPPFKALGVTWDEATLDKYLTGPRAMVPGTKMTYAGLKDDKKLADLIAYLATLK
jgi:cytochrome c2